jgi:Fe-S-cluster containining protein
MVEPLCVRCARAQKTCCQISEVYVSPGDVRRIAAFTGQNDFYHDQRPATSDYADQDDDPVWRDHVFQPDGSRRILRRTSSGDCIFLRSDGCCLPLDVRPLVCRLYPFDYDHRGLKQELSNGCPVHLIAPGRTLLEELQMSRAEATIWHRQLYAEITQEAQFRAGHCLEPTPSTLPVLPAG